MSSQVQELVATREPEKLYQAYILLADCDEFNRDHDRLIYDEKIRNGLIEGNIVGQDSDIAKFFAEDSQLLNAVGKELSTAERSAEMAAAQQIARNFRDRRKASR